MLAEVLGKDLNDRLRDADVGPPQGSFSSPITWSNTPNTPLHHYTNRRKKVGISSIKYELYYFGVMVYSIYKSKENPTLDSILLRFCSGVFVV